MTQVTEKGHFYVANLPSGKVIAASNIAPYFCFRAESEDAVIAKVKAALAFYRAEDRQVPTPTPAAATIHNWANRRVVPFSREAAGVA